jgi:hypothetical protein
LQFGIEIFICNYSAFRTIIVGNNNIETNYTLEDNTILISNINSRVTSILIKYKNELTDKITYELIYNAEDNSALISINPKVILENQKQYINFDTHSVCKSIQLNIKTNSDLEIEKIILNHPNFNINIYRIIIIFIAVIFIAKIKNETIYNLEYDKDSKLHNYRFILNLVVLCGFIVIYTLSQFNSDTFLINKEDIDKQDSIFMQTEALVNGQISLMVEPSEELKNMENPYDSVKRDEEGVSYLYDVAYYNGNYYNYFGIAPILTSILPFRLITGMYTHTYIFNMIYIVVAVFALSSLYKKLVNKYINKISLCNYYLGFYAILFASNIFTLLRGAKYDIVVSSGIAFLLISLNLVISIYENRKYKIPKLILLGITTSLIVLSKPNLIVYYFLIVFFYIIGINKLTTKEKIKDSICIAVPLGIFAVFQMVLNYVRFDNILEFGARYQLTGFNMNTCMSFTFGKIYAGLLEYIFKTPSINPLRFPFVFINTDISSVSVNELCYENRLIGLIAIPILWVYLFKKFIFKKTENKEFKKFIEVCIITGILSIIINSCLGGICEAYSVDFKLILAIGAVFLLLKWVEKSKDINKIFCILAVATILIMIPISLTTENNFLVNLTSSTTVFFKNIFEFWA